MTAKDVQDLVAKVADLEDGLKQRTTLALNKCTIVQEYHLEVEQKK